MYLMSKGQIIASGRVPFDVRFKEYDWGNLCTFGLNVDYRKDEGGQSHYDKINISTMGEIALAAKNIQKGDNVLCAGKMQSRKYTDKNNEEKEVKEMKCDFFIVMPKGIPVAVQGGGSSKLPDAAIDMDDDEDDPDKVPF